MNPGARGCPGAWRPAAAAALAAFLLGAASLAAEGVSENAWDAFREGERLVRDGDAPGALQAYTRARAALAAAAPLDRSLGEALLVNLYNLAAGFTTAGDVESSLASFEQAFLLRKGLGRLKDGALDATLRGGAERIAAYAVSVGKAGAALPVYAAMADLEPTDARLRLLQAGAFLAAGDLSHAREAALAARKIDPRSAEAWALTARIQTAESALLLARDDAREASLRLKWAADDLEQAVRIEPSSQARLVEWGEALGRLARRLRDEGDASGAETALSRAFGALDEAAAVPPPRAEIFLARARIVEAEGRFHDASDAYALAAEAAAKTGGGEGARLAAEAREGLARSRFVEAADAANEGRFDEAASLLEESRRIEPAGAAAARLAESIERRRARRRLIEEENGRILAESPGRADSLLALGDLSFHYGKYDEAYAYYEKLARSPGGVPTKVIRGRLLRARATSAAPSKLVEVEVPGGRIPVRYALEEGMTEVRKALAQAWARVATSPGVPPAPAPPEIVVHPNQRAFRTSGPRLGASAAYGYANGVISVYAEAGRDTASWIPVLAAGLGHWACDRLGAGRAPRWMCEGIARRAAGGPAGLDRERLAEASAAGRWVAAAEIDAALAALWNAEEDLALIRDEAAWLVETIAALKGEGAPGRLLSSLAGGAGRPVEEALRSVLGMDLRSLEAAARGSLRAAPAS